MQRPTVKAGVGISVLTGGVGAYALLIRPRLLFWGATPEERIAALPGDELISTADVQATRAITVHTAKDEVWPWIVQMGQGRAGLYSYDALENILGCDMHSADRIVEEWQAIAPGDPFRLHPEAELEVASVEPGRALVVRGGVQLSEESPPPFDFSWAFVLNVRPDDVTRLVVRERYQYKRRWAALLLEPVHTVSFFMTERMLRGIRDRAEGRSSGRAWAQARRRFGPRPRSS